MPWHDSPRQCISEEQTRAQYEEICVVPHGGGTSPNCQLVGQARH